MTFDAGRAAVQARLDELESERSLLLGILDAYDALASLRTPAPVVLTNGAAEPPTPAPIRHKKEAFLCSRCGASFKTRGWRDRHEAKHPKVPEEPFRQSLPALAASV